MKKLTESERRQRERVQISIKLDPENDADVIDILKQVEKKQTFIKDCIRYFYRVFSRVKIDAEKLGR